MTIEYFDPYNQHYTSWPTNTSKPTIGAFATGEAVGYAQGVLHYKTGHDCTPAQVPGPWNFDLPTVNAVKDLQSYFGQPVTGIIGAPEWSLIDWLNSL
jgi:hypothetical protein